jgi:glycosyltransferase involved in cell wall biosynthesis
MKILLLTTQLPYPPVSGGVIKTWRLVEHWARTADLQIICGLKNDDSHYLKAFEEKLPGIKIFVSATKRPRTPLNLLKSYLSSATLNVYRNASPSIMEKTKEWSVDADIIFVDHYEMAQFVPSSTNAKVVLHEHNAEYVMWERLGDIEKNPIKKWVLKIEAYRIKNAERLYANRANLIMAAPNDIDELVKIGVKRSKCTTTFHLGEDFMLDWPNVPFDSTEKSLLFIGTLTWEANIDGLLWFLQAVWPKLKKLERNLTFYIVGKNPDRRLLEATVNMRDIVFTGFVEDLEPYHQKGRVFVIPLRFGSGIKVKLLNALYRGIPVVTTPIGTEGLEAGNGKELYSTLDPAEQVKYIQLLLNDGETWGQMQTASRKLARRHYTWNVLLAKHDRELKSLL